MDENKIRQIVREEMQRGSNASRFNLSNISNHKHNGVDSLRINADDLVPSTSVSGSITFAQERLYTLRLNSSFTPTHIMCYGNVVGGSQRYITFGTAQLTPSFYFQPDTDTSVTVGGPQYPFVDPNHPEYGTQIPMQSSIYFGAESAGGALHTLAGNFHIVDIQFPVGTPHARATVIGYSRDAILVQVDDLDGGWEINATFVVS